MLQPLFGNRSAEMVLLYLAVNSESYTRELVDALGLRLFAVQQQLRRLEDGSIIVGRSRGRMRFYSLNPRWPLTPDLVRLLTRALEYLPAEERARYQPRRNRPRRSGKPAR